MRDKIILLGGQKSALFCLEGMALAEIQYRTVRSRRRTVTLRLLQDGSLQVRCPLQMTDRQVHAFVDSKRNWIEKQLAATSPATPLSQAELKVLTEQAWSAIGQRVAYFAEMMNLSYGRITIRHQKTRWGSCSGKGNLNFNCLLMLTPPEVMDYVVVHELCHLKQMNHSQRFWAEVARILPDYQQSRNWLRQKGRALIAKLP